MKIEIIPCLKDNYSYLVIDEKKNIACVVDPSESEPIIKYLSNNKIDLKFILNTHHHYDHVGGNKKLKEKYGANIVGFKGDQDKIPEIDILVNDQEIWKYEDIEENDEEFEEETSKTSKKKVIRSSSRLKN